MPDGPGLACPKPRAGARPKLVGADVRPKSAASRFVQCFDPHRKPRDLMVHKSFREGSAKIERLVGADFKPALFRQTPRARCCPGHHPPRRIIRDVIANASQCFLVANDVLVAAALPHDATLAGTFIDAASGECFEATHDFRNGVARFRLIGENDDVGGGF